MVALVEVFLHEQPFQLMQQVTLQFKLVELLWHFKHTIKAQEVEINLKQCTLTCHCSEKELAMAKESFAATLIADTSSHQK